MTDDLTDAVLLAEQRRCDAMLAADLDVLASLLADDLIFVHATGEPDGKAAYLAKLAAGRIAYVAITWPERAVRLISGDVAILTGRMVTDVRVDGVAKRLLNRVTAVWLRTDDSIWAVTAFQSTPERAAT